MIYNGSPVWLLPEIAAIIPHKLRTGKRCLYLNAPTLVAGLERYLADAGVDVEAETKRGSLILSSDLSHLHEGRFEPERMLGLLSSAAHRASSDGYKGLFAVGDITWEFGNEKNFDKLRAYEQGLEQLFEQESRVEGICQYHLDTLPESACRTALELHRGCFINRALSVLNPYHLDGSAVMSPLDTAKLMATPADNG